MARPKIVAFVNFKGGVGKSNAVLNTSGALAAQGLKVYVVDLDQQPTATYGMVGSSKVPRRGTAEVLETELSRLTGIPPREGPLKIPDVLLKVEEFGLHLVPSDGPRMRALEKAMSVEQGAEKLLKRALKGVDADIVLLDCPGNLGIFTVNALLAATSIIIPVSMEDEAASSFVQLLDAIDRIRAAADVDIPIDWILPTMFHGREKLAKESIAALESTFGKESIHRPIRRRMELKKVFRNRKPIHKLFPKSEATEDYAALAQSIIEKGAS